MWVLTRRRPTGPRRGTTVLVMGAMTHAGLAVLTIATLGATAAMLPGVIDSFAAL